MSCNASFVLQKHKCSFSRLSVAKESNATKKVDPLVSDGGKFVLFLLLNNIPSFLLVLYHFSHSVKKCVFVIACPPQVSMIFFNFNLAVYNTHTAKSIYSTFYLSQGSSLNPSLKGCCSFVAVCYAVLHEKKSLYS